MIPETERPNHNTQCLSRRAVIFDCDGVLVDSEPAMAEISALAFQEWGAPATAADFMPLIGHGEEDYFGSVAQKYGLQFNAELRQQIYDKYEQLADMHVKPTPRVVELILSLERQGFCLAVASSSVASKVKVNLETLRLPEGTFDCVLTGNDIERKKPFPDIYLLAADRMGIDPAKCLVIEDATSGIRAGKAANMTVIGFTSAHSAAELKAAGADYIVHDLMDIETWIAEWKTEE